MTEEEMDFYPPNGEEEEIAETEYFGVTAIHHVFASETFRMPDDKIILTVGGQGHFNALTSTVKCLGERLEEIGADFGGED